MPFNKYVAIVHLDIVFTLITSPLICHGAGHHNSTYFGSFFQCFSILFHIIYLRVLSLTISSFRSFLFDSYNLSASLTRKKAIFEGSSTHHCTGKDVHTRPLCCCTGISTTLRIRRHLHLHHHWPGQVEPHAMDDATVCSKPTGLPL